MTHGGWWVYILLCGDGTLYTGIARDVAARFAAHRAGKGAKYTRARGAVAIVYQEPATDRSGATQREAQLKRMTRAEKLVLVAQGAVGMGEC